MKGKAEDNGKLTNGPMMVVTDLCGHTVVRVSAEHMKGVMAQAMLDPPDPVIRLGDIDLAPHQREAVTRLERELTRSGGALLADAVGLGKTYVALALAASAARPLIVAPAALRRIWGEALARTGVRAQFISTQRLSLGVPPIEEPDLVIVDEAHHFRNPSTRRHASLAEIARRARVLLLTATPVHNTGRELDALLGLFLGSSASALDDAERARCIVRRDSAATWGGAVPRVERTRWLTLTQRDELLDAIAALPPPVPPSDGDEAGALLTFSLLRQWASSEGALSAALRRRLARAAALIAALEEGRHPSRAELTAWRFVDDALQLAFPGLIAGEAAHSTEALLAQARRHEEAVRAVVRSLASSADGRAAGAAAHGDAERAERLRALRAEHVGERIVVFSQFADTVDAMWRELRGDPRVCALAGRGARVAGGAISRAEALARFAPAASKAARPGEAERIDLLLTTDLLSEGVNLQDASVIVHLDLPWTPARIEQRVGRLARPGASRDRVAVYAFAPPARAESVLAVERRLQAKLRAAARSAGVSGTIVPGLLGIAAVDERSPAEHQERIRRVLSSWRCPGRPAAIDAARGDRGASRNPALVVAEVAASRTGFIALVVEDVDRWLIASLGGPATDDPGTVAEALAIADRAPALRSVHTSDDAALATTLVRIDAWIAARAGAAEVDLRFVRGDRARRRVMSRIAAILGRAPRQARGALSPLALDARRAASLPLGSGGERVLAELADASMPDEAWLRALSAFGSAHQRPGPIGAEPMRDGREHRSDTRIAAVLVLGEG